MIFFLRPIILECLTRLSFFHSPKNGPEYAFTLLDFDIDNKNIMPFQKKKYIMSLLPHIINHIPYDKQLMTCIIWLITSALGKRIDLTKTLNGIILKYHKFSRFFYRTKKFD